MDRVLSRAGRSVRLRHTAPADLDWVLAAEGAAENRPYVTQWTRQEHESTLGHPDTSHLIVETLAGARRVGYVILAGLEAAREAVELRRIVITDKGRGYGRETLRLIKTMALDELRTRRLWLDVRTNNPAAKRLYEAEGFAVEGTTHDGLIILSIRREDEP
jgi:RimJ/RimL family protein N-acetyltransferase